MSIYALENLYRNPKFCSYRLALARLCTSVQIFPHSYDDYVNIGVYFGCSIQWGHVSYGKRTIYLHCRPVNPFVSNAPFLFLLKNSENRKVSWCFQGAEKGCIENKGVNCFFMLLIFTGIYFRIDHN